ncbi:hypothetical protein LMH87_009781 [Akanthomyces muscarius]|uniref:Uncharacterized protein n=1 Tax=Akanthomyces muscarius TaxID=2231603 RepID=A0A9W8QCI8_AKAMU|nr:hypothetical protein LMH87_009781 [Akanthomyces muscarius]KAJ4153286.1 hypothetical protein LMH87_009781 [Akanthomyces muscarius]
MAPFIFTPFYTGFTRPAIKTLNPVWKQVKHQNTAPKSHPLNALNSGLMTVKPPEVYPGGSGFKVERPESPAFFCSSIILSGERFGETARAVK